MDNGLGNLDHGLNIQGMLDSLPVFSSSLVDTLSRVIWMRVLQVDSTFSSTLPSPAVDYAHAGMRGTVPGPSTYFNGTDPYTPATTNTSAGPRALDGMGGGGYPHMVC